MAQLCLYHFVIMNFSCGHLAVINYILKTKIQINYLTPLSHVAPLRVSVSFKLQNFTGSLSLSPNYPDRGIVHNYQAAMSSQNLNVK